METREAKRKVLEIAPCVFKDSRILFAYLYGSYAVDQAHAFSDLDVGIYVSSSAAKNRLDLEMSLSLEIDKHLAMGLQSDVRTMNFLPLSFVGTIVTEGLLIFCRDDTQRIEYETIVRSAYFDFLPFLRNYQRTYLEQTA